MSETVMDEGCVGPGKCTRCGELAHYLSADWEECGDCTAEREEWERDTPEWVKLGMSGMWGE